MKSSVRKLAAVTLVAVGATASGSAVAQTEWADSPGPASAEAGEIKGRVTAMNLQGRTVMLDDGTVLHLEDSRQVAFRDLEERATVRATYDERNGEKFATSLWVEMREVQAP